MLCGALLLCCAVAAFSLVGCGGGGQAGATGDEGSTDGPAYEEPASIQSAAFDAAAAIASSGGSIDVSHVADGYVAASATNAARLKFQVICGDGSYNYDLPGDGTPIVCPLNMGDGAYTFRIMQNTSGNNYVEIASASAQVTLASEFEPYLRPNQFCDYDDASACVAQAAALPPALLTRETSFVPSTNGLWTTSPMITTKPPSWPPSRATSPIPTGPTRSAPASASTTRRLLPRCCAAWGSRARW